MRNLFADDEQVALRVLEIPMDLPPRGCSPNEIGSRCWQARSAAVSKYRGHSKEKAGAVRPQDWEQRPIKIDAYFYCGLSSTEKGIREAKKQGKKKHLRSSRFYRPLDTANGISSLKAAIDGLVDAGIILADSRHWVSWGEVEILRTQKEHKGQCGLLLVIRQQPGPIPPPPKPKSVKA